MTGYGSTSGGFFQNSASSGFARLGFGHWGIAAFGNYTGAYLGDADGTGYAWLGYDRPSGTDNNGIANDGEYGVYAGGSRAGGYFENTQTTTYAYLAGSGSGVRGGGVDGGVFHSIGHSGYTAVATTHFGIIANGNAAGGGFYDADGTGYAWLGYDDEGGGTAMAGEYGVYAGGGRAGGFFEDTDGSSYAYIGWDATGVVGYGDHQGGRFRDIDGTGEAEVGKGDVGVQGFGEKAGGIFHGDYVGLRRAYVGYSRPSGQTDAGGTENEGKYGIYAEGAKAGGYFEDSFVGTGGYSWAYLAHNDRGIESFGSEAGGYFEDSNSSSHAFVAYDSEGIAAYGSETGGYFKDTNSSGTGYVGRGNLGIWAFGDTAGGWFEETDSAALARVAYDTYKISGTGAVSFVQNHPYDRDSVIVYAAPEGDEVATYTRGTSRLVDGEARVTLGETFRWVTNPDVGLTAHLTPRGEPIPLAIVDLSTEAMVVRAPGNAPDDLVFDYIVYGLRIGFEESSIVQEKEQEAYIPSMTSHRELYQRRPDLKNYNSLERFKGMRHAINAKAKLDLSRANALRDAIIEFDPAVHELPRPPGIQELRADESGARAGEQRDGERLQAVRADRRERGLTDHSEIGATSPVDGDAVVYVPSAQSSSRRVVDLVDVSEAVEAGDVLVIGRDSAGAMRRGFEGHDPGVVGVVAANPGEVLDSRSPVLAAGDTAEESVVYAEVAMAGVVNCKVDAAFGAIWPGDLLVTSPTSGHAMRTETPLPGTIVGKALEPLDEGTGLIRVLVMLQ